MKKLSSAPAPIGVFDSGYGGLTVLTALRKQLPKYDYIYLGDNARTPYGSRSFEVVYEYTLQCVEKLFEYGCHLVILACNTASAKALRNIQQLDLPRIAPQRRVLGVIRPTAEVVGELTHNHHVGLLATQGTIQSGSYIMEIAKLHPKIQVVGEACPMWVPLIENNEHNQPGADYFVQKNLQNLFQKDPKIDCLILACTHYPLLMHKIKQYIPSNVFILSQGKYVALSLETYLHRHPEIAQQCTQQGSVRYLTTEAEEKFESSARIFLEEKITVERVFLKS